MTDLSKLVGLTVLIDEDQGRVSFGNEIMCEEKIVRLTDIIPVLLNKYLRYPELVYKFHPNVRKTECGDCQFSYNFFYIPYGLLGVEFMKTHVYFSEFQENKYSSFVEVHSGNLSVIIQRNGEREDEFDSNTYVEELKVVHLVKGQKLAIPSGVYYTFVNTGVKPAIFSMITSPILSIMDYQNIKKEKGLACFVISKNSKVATVINPKYKIRSKLQTLSLEKFMKQEGFKEIFLKPFVKFEEPLVNFMDRSDDLVEFIVG